MKIPLLALIVFVLCFPGCTRELGKEEKQARWKAFVEKKLCRPLSEEEARLLWGINKSPGPDSRDGNSRTLLFALNMLISAGEQKANTALQMYEDLCKASDNDDWMRHGISSGRLLYLIRLLYVAESPSRPLNPMRLGAPTGPEFRLIDSCWPQFPLVVVDDWPIILYEEWLVAGCAENPMSYLEYCRQNGVFRSSPYDPTETLEDALNHLFASDCWKEEFGGAAPGREAFVRSRAISGE